jgi:ABC-type polysaccharide/polyol phosphate export permease
MASPGLSPETIGGGLRFARMLARRDLHNRYVSSYAGFAWNIGVPLLNALISVIVFSVLMSGRMGERYGDIPFALFYFVPFSLWTVFSEVASRSTGILREYSYLINKIAFPVWVIPMIPFASALIGQAVMLALVALLLVYFQIPLADTFPVYLLLWGVMMLFTAGVAYLVSALSLYIPDLVQAVPVGVNILFWLTPILYPATLVENYGVEWVSNLIMNYNFFHYLVDNTRHAVFGSAQVDWTAVLVISAVAVSMLILGVAVFRKLQSGFADVV